MMDDANPAPAGDPPEPVGAPPPANRAGKRDIGPWLKWGAIVAVALALVALIGGYFLPREPEVTRSIDIAVPRAAVFPLVADLRRLPEWSPEFAADPGIAVTFTGPLDGVGQTIAWQSGLAEVGAGAETIMAIEPDRAVTMTVTRPDETPTTAWFQLEEKSVGTTTVVWGHRTDVGLNPIDRYRGLAIDGQVGPRYERALLRLKALAETPPEETQPPTAD